jgi:hypothetical protein
MQERDRRGRDQERMMTPRTHFAPAASWTQKLDTVEKEEHDFSNLLAELGYAIRRNDMRMMSYCEHELRRMFRDKRRAVKGRR